MKIGKFLVGAALVAGLTASGATPSQAENELLGGLLGGAAGAGVGAAFGGGKGAAIGGILGLGVGALGANQLSKPKQPTYAAPPAPAYQQGYAPPQPAYQQGYAPPSPPTQGYAPPQSAYQQGYAPPQPAYQQGYAPPSPPTQGYVPPPPPTAYQQSGQGIAPQPAPSVQAAFDTSYCREYTTITVIDGTEQKSHGTACRQADGTWRIVN